MSKSRKPYPPEFREQMVALVRAGRTPEELSREFEPSAQSISNWEARGHVREARGQVLNLELSEVVAGPNSLFKT